MRNRLIVVVVTAILAGCCAPPKQEEAAPPAPVEMDSKWIVALGTTKLGSKHLAPPNAADRAYAAQLPQEVLPRCLRFLGRPLPSKDSPVQPMVWAAREVDRYVLVDIHYKGGPSDSDEFVVYCTDKQQAIGEFVWYGQP